MSVLLESRDVCKYFGGVKAVDHVNMRISKGEIFGIIGPNGAGKSTFFNVITGLYSATHGSVLFEGQEITGKSPEEIATMGLARTFQNIRLFTNMRVIDNIKIGFHIRTKTNVFQAMLHSRRYREDEQMAMEESIKLLERVGLEAYRDMKAGNLAYGTQRKVEIARALALDPKILLLDEPAAGMNPAETTELMRFVRQLNDSGYTIAVIEHDMKFIMNLCHRLIVLDHGTCIADGSPLEIRNDPDVIRAYFGSKSIRREGQDAQS